MESPSGSINAAGVASSIRHGLIGLIATAIMIVAGVIERSGGPENIENLNNGIDWAPYLKALYVGLSAFAVRFLHRLLTNVPAEIPGAEPKGIIALLKRVF